MIPQTPVSQVESTTANEILPTKTYRLDFETKRIIGVVEGREAVLQFIRKTMNTDKYAYEIYDWYYGNELYRLIGQPYEYVVTRLPNIMKEALMVDNRIKDVRQFTFNRLDLDTPAVTSIVDTVYGEIKYEQEVPL